MIKDESVLSRWSRRKLQSDQQTLKEDVGIELQQQNDSAELVDIEFDDLSDKHVEEHQQQEVLTDADMPEIETLHEDSDYSGFMSPGVSDELRNLALKKLFQAPSFNIRDGLDEYDEDYTTFEKLGDIITCDMKHQIELEAEEKLQRAQQAVMEDEDASESELIDETAETELQQESTSIEHHQATDGTMVDNKNMQDRATIPTENNTDNHPQEIS